MSSSQTCRRALRIICTVATCFVVIDLVVLFFQVTPRNLLAPSIDRVLVPSKKEEHSQNDEVPNQWPWNDMDFSKMGKCGYHKCFFDSLSSKKEGYVVADVVSQFKDMRFAYHLASELEAKFGSKHFYLKPPVKYNITAGLRSMVNKLADQTAQRDRGKEAKDILDSTRAAVQHVDKVPEGSLFFGDSRLKFKRTLRDLNVWSQHITDKAAFVRQIDEERKRILRVYEYYPNVVADFHAFIMTDGSLYHFDLEGPPVLNQGGMHDSNRKSLERVQNRLAHVAGTVNARGGEIVLRNHTGNHTSPWLR